MGFGPDKRNPPVYKTGGLQRNQLIWSNHIMQTIVAMRFKRQHNGYDITQLHQGTHTQRRLELPPGWFIAAHTMAQSWLECEFAAPTLDELIAKIDASTADRRSNPWELPRLERPAAAEREVAIAA
jgi:hypothetical protein